MKKLFKYIKNYNGKLAFSAFFHLMTAIFTVVSIPLIIPFFQILFEREVALVSKPESVMELAGWVKYFGSNLVNNHGKVEALMLVCGFIILVFFFKNLFRYLAAYFIIPVRNGVIKNIRSDLYRTYLVLPTPFFDRHNRGDLISRMNADASEIEWSILSFLEVFFKSPLIILGSLAFMLYVSPQLSIFVFVLLAFTILVIGFVSRKLKQTSGEVQSSMGKMTSLLEQSLAGIEIIKAYRAEGFLQHKFDKQNEGIFSGLNKILRRKDMSSPLSEFLGVTIVAVLLAYGSSMVFDNKITAETFFAFIFAFYQVIEPAKSFSTAYFNLKKGMAAVDRIDEILELPTSSVEAKQDGLISENWNSIRFDQVDFTYEGLLTSSFDEQASTLSQISFELDRGKKLAIVGSSGSGKSTIFKLLLQQYSEYAGNIFIGEQDLKDIHLGNLRSTIAIVTQTPILFNDTIKQNILLGRAYDESKMKFVLEQTLLHELVAKLPQGLEYEVGDSGSLLSGGEKQRISIARALYGDPQILLFDEATSSLDAKSEREVTTAIHKAIENRTAIIIAHRLSTIKLVDDVLVLEDGKVDQFGALQALTKEQGNFKSYLETYKSI